MAAESVQSVRNGVLKAAAATGVITATSPKPSQKASRRSSAQGNRLPYRASKQKNPGSNPVRPWKPSRRKPQPKHARVKAVAVAAVDADAANALSVAHVQRKPRHRRTTPKA